MAISIGEQIGDYEVIGTLGAGGIGEVYKVRHLISQRTEALKVLRPQQMGSTEPMERFMREIRVLASLNHPGIAALHTAFRRGEDLVMVMEFVEGDTLSSRLRSSGISIANSIEYVRQVLLALVYAHGQGVIHRDIKPSNAMVDSHDRIKLLDFGLAVTGHDPSLTAAGWILGSLHYMSPEQVNGKKVDCRSDLYSLGATLYELLTGKVPIEGETGYAIMAGHLHHQPTAPSTLNPNIPDELSRVVMKALAKNPDERYQTAREFLQALDATNLEKTEALRMSQVFHVGTPSGSSGLAPGAQVTPLAPSPVAPASGSAPTVPLPHALAQQPQGHQRSGSGTQPLEAPISAAKTPSSSYSPAVLDKIAKELAIYIGPIAKIVVQKAASKHSSLQDLYNALAEEIESGKDREKFLATRRTIKS